MDLRRWAIVYVATVSGEDSDEIDCDAPMQVYDFDSVDAVEMALEFEKTFETRADPEWFMKGEQSLSVLISTLEEARKAPPAS
ncbi:hypothetical protein ASG52_24495 [Methylobacterium sp. Leaf456]|uniref:acyl carrier protein n=1 Tax=Methylobacterium sp. Leaf456 TaxID=1736382 RepID=UPI0006F6B7EB|nr:acyl carrier protein [Methylobacterium sp. Leaf456]KQT56083.1 hypothetical protein ASG52_24495 [Methylobacterium sp. Leaf456]